MPASVVLRSDFTFTALRRLASRCADVNQARRLLSLAAILDALNNFEGPVLEVHISNIHKRGSFRHHSFVPHRADGVMAGYGVQGYNLALRRLAKLAKDSGQIA